MITPEIQAALSEPFPSDFIQQVPKGGRSLNYVSHGRVTERLLQVDPNWTWEPLGFTESGTPATVKHGNFVSLWGKMTLGGVQRIGVGTVDLAANRGNSEPDIDKELVSDFIRNAAMRFGVGLHLWLGDPMIRRDSAPSPFPTTPQAPPPANLGDRVAAAAGQPTAPTQPVSSPDSGELLSTPQSKNLYRLWKHTLNWDQQQYLQQCELELGVPVTDDRKLTKAQASTMIKALKIRAGEPVDDGPPPAQSYDPGPTEPSGYGYSEEPF